MGRDQHIKDVLDSAGTFQSTRPHGARPSACPKTVRANPVSIHAPAWGATVKGMILVYLMHVSIHAPAWGATKSAFRPSRFIHCFNPRARMGRDDYSFHATPLVVMFQSTRPHGARL